MQQVGLFLITLQLGLALLRPVHFHSFSLINSRFDRMRTKLFTSLQDSMNTDTLLKSIKDGPIPVSEREYIINGWRWHTASVIRDLNRFLDVIKSLESVINENNIGSDTTDLNKAGPVKRLLESYNYVCNFNMKALMKVERDIFFPWLQDLLPRSAGSLMEAILDEHIALNKASASIGSICNSLERITSSPVMTASNKKEILSNINRISELVNDLLTSSSRIQKCQEAVFVPYISRAVLLAKEGAVVSSNNISTKVLEHFANPTPILKPIKAASFKYSIAPLFVAILVVSTPCSVAYFTKCFKAGFITF